MKDSVVKDIVKRAEQGCAENAEKYNALPLKQKFDAFVERVEDFMEQMRKDMFECIYSRDARHHLLIAEMRAESEGLRNRLDMMSKLVQYSQRNSGFPETWNKMSLDELAGVATTFTNETSEIEPDGREIRQGD